jgi:hypothetical protein
VGYLFHFARCIALATMLASASPAQVSILQIQVVEGEGIVHVPGARTNRAVTVAVADESGKAVAGAAVSFHLPETGPGGTFGNGMRTDVAITDARGRAAVRSFQSNRLPGRFQIRIVASKEQARAGTVSFQYVGEPAAGGAEVRSHRKWFVVAAAAGGAVLAGALASRGSSPPSTIAPPPLITPPVPVLTIGPPTISIGKP